MKSTFDLLNHHILKLIEAHPDVVPPKPWDFGDSIFSLFNILPTVIFDSFIENDAVPLELVTVEELKAKLKCNNTANHILCGYKHPTIKCGAPFSAYSALKGEVGDCIYIPHPLRFRKPELFYGVLFHEMIHSTAHESRLDRSSARHEEEGGDQWLEEMTAELGSLFIMSWCGMRDATMDHSIGYLKQCHKRAGKDKDAKFFLAAHQANVAAHYIANRELENEAPIDFSSVANLLG